MLSLQTGRWERGESPSEPERGSGGVEGAREPGQGHRSAWGKAVGEGLTSGKSQLCCLLSSTILFPRTVAMEDRRGSCSKRQLPIPSRRALSRACRLQLLKFRPGRKLGRAARKVGAVDPWRTPAHPLFASRSYSLCGGLHDAALGRGWARAGAAVPRWVMVQAQAVAQLMGYGGGNSQDAYGVVLWGRGVPGPTPG